MCYQMVPLTREMLPDLLALEQACFTAPWTEGMFLGELDNPAAVYRIIRYEGESVAYMGMWCVADEGQITNIAVSPVHRRRGLATRLMTYFIELARARSLQLLTLEVRADNQAAIVLYQKMGFQTVGRRRGYYENGEDALLMTLFLEAHPADGEGVKKE